MKTKLLKYILLCAFTFNFVQTKQVSASEPNLIPPMKTIPQEELKTLLEKMDKAIDNDKFLERDKSISFVNQYVSEENMRFRGSYTLAYNNPEVKDIIVKLYLKECAKINETDPNKGISETNPWFGGEGGAEYMIGLMTIAESTFDPRLYENEMRSLPVSGDLRLLYIATVNPSDTLKYLFESKCGERTGKQGHPDYFYHGEVAWGMSVDDAYTLLSLMCVQSPKTLISERDKVMSFAKEHLKHFASARKVDERPESVYLKGQDYDVRNGALDVLKLLGTEKDISLVEEIIANAPVLDSKELKGGPYNRHEQIKQKGESVIKLLQQRAKISQK
jgi:hypothetical protein